MPYSYGPNCCVYAFLKTPSPFNNCVHNAEKNPKAMEVLTAAGLDQGLIAVRFCRLNGAVLTDIQRIYEAHGGSTCPGCSVLPRPLGLCATCRTALPVPKPKPKEKMPTGRRYVHRVGWVNNGKQKKMPRTQAEEAPAFELPMLPATVITNVLQFAAGDDDGYRTLLAVAKVCRVWRAGALAADILWKPVAKTLWETAEQNLYSNKHVLERKPPQEKSDDAPAIQPPETGQENSVEGEEHEPGTEDVGIVEAKRPAALMFGEIPSDYETYGVHTWHDLAMAIGATLWKTKETKSKCEALNIVCCKYSPGRDSPLTEWNATLSRMALQHAGGTLIAAAYSSDCGFNLDTSLTCGMCDWCPYDDPKTPTCYPDLL